MKHASGMGLDPGWLKRYTSEPLRCSMPAQGRTLPAPERVRGEVGESKRGPGYYGSAARLLRRLGSVKA